MFESIVQFVVSNFFGEYVGQLDATQISFALLQGWFFVVSGRFWEVLGVFFNLSEDVEYLNQSWAEIEFASFFGIRNAKYLYFKPKNDKNTSKQSEFCITENYANFDFRQP
jgi:hypothetical protein